MDLASTSTEPKLEGGLPPPPGVTPNFTNPYSVQPTIIATLVICIVVPSIFVFLRVYTKLFLAKTHGWEDCKCSCFRSMSSSLPLLLINYRHLLYRVGQCSTRNQNKLCIYGVPANRKHYS